MTILFMGETLLRYSTPKGKRFNSLEFDVCLGGCETNVAANLAQMGMDTKLLTKLPNNAIGDAVERSLKQYGVDTSLIMRHENRMGAYFLECGSGSRTSQVVYDRKDSAMTTFKLSDIDMERVFDGIDMFFVSGIAVALSDDLQEAIIEMLKYCNAHNITIAYDNNYRKKLWTEKEAGKTFRRIIPHVDILSAGYLDAKTFLDIVSNKATHKEKICEIYTKMKAKYPNLKYITSTNREIISTSTNRLTGYIYADKLYTSETYVLEDIVDRVGGGDAYFAGILYGIIHNMPIQDTVEFGCCSSALKHTVHGDINAFSAEEINILRKNGIAKINR